jgi:hypothetical protein
MSRPPVRMVLTWGSLATSGFPARAFSADYISALRPGRSCAQTIDAAGVSFQGTSDLSAKRGESIMAPPPS